MKKDILVIFGGHNTEYYASCDSVGGMLDCIDQEKFNVLKLGVTIDGQWLLTTASAEEIKDGKTWLKLPDNKRAILSPERNKNALLVFDNNSVTEQHIDCVFPLISGYGGEDGTLQGLLELSNTPYVGADVAASANAMDKALTRLFADAAGLKQPYCLILKRNEYVNSESKIEQEIDFGYPVFVKPVSLGSSVGISRVSQPSELKEAIENAFKYESKIMIEQGIEGKEIKVAVLGNEHPITGEVCELTVPKGTVNDYETKHIKFTSKKKIPADINEEITIKAKNDAIKIYKELECEGMARVDFFLSDDGELYFNEINTVPGIGKHSIYSQMFESAGLPIKDMLTKLINTAFESRRQVEETKEETFKDII